MDTKDAIIERAAKALREKCADGDPQPAWEQIDENFRQEYRAEARAVLEAVGFDGMLEASKAAIPEIRCLYQQLTRKNVDDLKAGSVRRALDMLNAAIARATAKDVQP